MKEQLRVLIFFWLIVVPGGGFAAEEDSSRLPRTNLMVFRDAAGWLKPVANAADWQRRRGEILAGMQQIMGALPGAEKRCPLDVKVEEEVDCGDYTRQLISYASEPGSRVPAYLLVPKAGSVGARSGSAENPSTRRVGDRRAEDKRRFPAVLALHQTHSAGQKVVVGLGSSTNDEYGVALVKRGFVVLAPPYTMLANYWPDLRALGYRSGTMKSIWDNIRGLDLLASLPFVQTNRGFGAIGHSLGGHNGVYTAVFDERISVVVSSCGLDSFVDYYDGDPKNWQPERGWCQLRYMPALTNYAGRLAQIPFDFPELVGALAPRSCFINSPLGDSNFRWRSVDEISKAARPVYELYSKPQNLIVEHPDCGHLFPPEMREKAYRLLEGALK